MKRFVIFTTLLASTMAAPALLLETHLVHAPVKSTLTKSSQVINHGGTTIVHAPVLPVHTVHHVPVHTVHVSAPSKTTITENSQTINHGGHYHATIPIVHQPLHTVIHEPVHIAHTYTQVPIKSKTTVTKNSQHINHGGENIIHVDSGINDVKGDLATSSQFFKLDSYEFPHAEGKLSRSGDSAVSHHSSTVHETVAEFHHLPLYSLHH